MVETVKIDALWACAEALQKIAKALENRPMSAKEERPDPVEHEPEMPDLKPEKQLLFDRYDTPAAMSLVERLRGRFTAEEVIRKLEAMNGNPLIASHIAEAVRQLGGVTMRSEEQHRLEAGMGALPCAVRKLTPMELKQATPLSVSVRVAEQIIEAADKLRGLRK